jgi:uncharacterized membrane protein
MTIQNTIFVFTISDIVQVTILAAVVLTIGYLYIADLIKRKFR